MNLVHASDDRVISFSTFLSEFFPQGTYLDAQLAHNPQWLVHFDEMPPSAAGSCDGSVSLATTETQRFRLGKRAAQPSRGDGVEATKGGGEFDPTVKRAYHAICNHDTVRPDAGHGRDPDEKHHRRHDATRPAEELPMDGGSEVKMGPKLRATSQASAGSAVAAVVPRRPRRPKDVGPALKPRRLEPAAAFSTGINLVSVLGADHVALVNPLRTTRGRRWAGKEEPFGTEVEDAFLNLVFSWPNVKTIKFDIYDRDRGYDEGHTYCAVSLRSLCCALRDKLMKMRRDGRPAAMDTVVIESDSTRRLQSRGPILKDEDGIRTLEYNTGWDNSGVREWVGLHRLSNLLPCIKEFVLRRTGCKPNWLMDFGVDDTYEWFQIVGFLEAATLPAWKLTDVTLCRFNLTTTAPRTLLMPVKNTLRRVNLRNCVQVLERVAATDFGGDLAKLQQGRVRDDDATPVMLKHLERTFRNCAGPLQVSTASTRPARYTFLSDTTERCPTFRPGRAYRHILAQISTRTWRTDCRYTFAGTTRLFRSRTRITKPRRGGS
ncbi:hypothetical protein MAPG_11984 [Magnaporthiopsis poae ATCC 64411]|uniref:Uncharacterized protein n=1 Tax=Magnaporthiopsis poae (strain ATCC 64411 / 73-15) TaxID=644358 RepID=A0A0C4EGL8_MAGP6|nr:hypothetical protein MAPG_11984 [Magnaporthiopsis poae ATCC 64411]